MDRGPRASAASSGTLSSRLRVHSGAIDLNRLTAQQALLLRGRGRELDGAPACARLPDGTGVWIQVAGRTFCPDGA